MASNVCGSPVVRGGGLGSEAYNGALRND